MAAFGLIFGPKTLAIPRTAAVDQYASILPKYRGAASIAAAIASGDEVTGISLMNMDVGLDTGPVIAVGTLEIAPEDTTESLTARLSDFGAELAVAHLAEYASGLLEPVVQDDLRASVVRPLKKADGWLDWTKPAEELERWVRAAWPWPRAWTTVDGEPFQIHKASVVHSSSAHIPGTVFLNERESLSSPAWTDWC